MSLQVISRDYSVVALGLMAEAKRHERIEFIDQDESIRDLLARAVELFERFTELSINPITVRWSIASADWTYPYWASEPYRLRCPVSPVANTDWTVKDPANVDVTASYVFTTNDISGLGEWYFQGPTGQLTVDNLKSGFANPDTIPPGVRDVLMRIFGDLWDNRESTSATTLELHPGWAETVMAGYWRPRL